MRLPLNATVESQLASLEKDPAQLFDATNPFRLLYSLQIMGQFIKTKSAEELSQWAARFLSRGGVPHLVSLFLASTTTGAKV